MPFPRVNEGQTRNDEEVQTLVNIVEQAGKKAAPFAAAAVAVDIALWYGIHTG